MSDPIPLGLTREAYEAIKQAITEYQDRKAGKLPSALAHLEPEIKQAIAKRWSTDDTYDRAMAVREHFKQLNAAAQVATASSDDPMIALGYKKASM